MYIILDVKRDFEQLAGKETIFFNLQTLGMYAFLFLMQKVFDELLWI